jgi:hypothetical protein
VQKLAAGFPGGLAAAQGRGHLYSSLIVYSIILTMDRLQGATALEAEGGSESHSSDSDDDGVDSEDEHTAVAATGDS